MEEYPGSPLIPPSNPSLVMSPQSNLIGSQLQRSLGDVVCRGYTSLVKRLPALRETRVQSLGWEDPLEKEMATHSSILAWEIPETEEPGGPWGLKESDTTEQLN